VALDAPPTVDTSLPPMDWFQPWSEPVRPLTSEDVDKIRSTTKVETRADQTAPARPAHLISDYLDECELAEDVGRALRTVRGWRRNGAGPPYIVLGKRVYYRRAAVRTWLLAKERTASAA
jgi:hypothetical protein